MTERPYKVTVEKLTTGEWRGFRLTERQMTLVRRALRAYKGAPRFLAQRFDFRR